MFAGVQLRGPEGVVGRTITRKSEVGFGLVGQGEQWEEMRR